MAELIWRLRSAPRTYSSDLLWVLLVGTVGALVLGYALTVSIAARRIGYQAKTITGTDLAAAVPLEK